MCDALVWSFDAITSVSWLEVIKALAPVATAVIAFIALQNWQRQDKAKREAEFLDALIEATHTYIADMPKPVTLFELSKIGMASNVPPQTDGDDLNKLVSGAIAYVKKSGELDAKRLSRVLEAIRPVVIKLKSLAKKGLVFGFSGYDQCLNAITELVECFDQLQMCAVIIGDPTMDWMLPEMRVYLERVVNVDPDNIRARIEKSNVAIIEFARVTYKKIYG